MKFLDKAAKIKSWSGFKSYLKWLRWKYAEARKYGRWINAHEITDDKRREIRTAIEAFGSKPKISVVMPVYNVAEKWLRLAIESVLRQLYENWELCIADDASPAPHIRKVLEEYASRDTRIKLVFRAENGHISAASNSALELATGAFVALLDHDDELSEDALFWVIKEINAFSETAMIYSDEDLIDEKGRRHAPKFKPDFSRDLFYSLNLITHLSVYRTEILQKIGGFRLGAEGSQDYDLAMRVVEEIREDQIRHIPRILYHWRVIKGSVSFSLDEKPYAHERARDAIRRHFERTGKRAEISRAIINLHRVRYDLPANLPKISLILSGGDHLKSKIFTKETDYQNLEIIECAAETAEDLNRAAAKSSGEILCFVDANLRPLSKDWLAELASFATQKEIGAVGAKLLDKDEIIMHGGLVIGATGVVDAAHRGLPRDSAGSFLRAQIVNNFSAVSISCLAVRRDVFESVGGFDAKNLPNRFFDADLCLKLREQDLRIVYTPYAELIQTDEKKRLNLEKDPTAEEKEFFVEKWQKFIENDPFYNPNLSYKSGDFSIEI